MDANLFEIIKILFVFAGGLVVGWFVKEQDTIFLNKLKKKKQKEKIGFGLDFNDGF